MLPSRGVWISCVACGFLRGRETIITLTVMILQPDNGSGNNCETAAFLITSLHVRVELGHYSMCPVARAHNIKTCIP